MGSQNSNKIDISFIIPCYNCAETIEKCVNSICFYSGYNYEIICIDDGSKDSTLKKLKKISSVNHKITVAIKENGGVSSARNYGINLANGKYIVFVDADDFLSSDCLFKIDELISLDCDFYIFNYYRLDKIYKYDICGIICDDKKVLYDLLCDFKINTVWAKIFRSKIIKDNNIYFNKNIKMGEDMLFIYDYIQHINKTMFSDVVFYNYIDNKNSAIQKSIDCYIYDFCFVYQYLIKSNYLSKNNKKILLYQMFSRIYHNVIHNRKIKYNTVLFLIKSSLYQEILQMKVNNLKLLIKRFILIMLVNAKRFIKFSSI